MAGPFRAQSLHANDATVQTYNTIATTLQPTYLDFPTSLQHDESGYAQHVGHSDIDIQASPIRQHDYTNDDTLRELQNTQYSPPADVTDGASAGQFRMLPPSNSKHVSWQALYDHAQSHAASEGYALSINTTAKNRSRIKLACVCYGQPKNTHKLTAETRIRKNRVSYKTGCKMWVEGKKLEDGTWLLRVGESQHNHPGRPSEGWAAQRKRTWGVVGGRIGVGGITAQEEMARNNSTNETLPHHCDANSNANGDEGEGEGGKPHNHAHKPNHLQQGGLVWKIVEQEMLRKSELFASRDGSVHRTVQVLQAQLTGIHIFKRDVYNIRAAIKRAWKAAEEQGGDSDDEVAEAEAQDEAVAEDDEDDMEEIPAKSEGMLQPEYHRHPVPSQTQTPDFVLDPSLSQPHPPSGACACAVSTTQVLSASSAEVEQLRNEVVRLKTMLGEKTKAVMERDIVISSLRSQLDYMAMLPS